MKFHGVDVVLQEGWDEILVPFLVSDSFKAIAKILLKAEKKQELSPELSKVFRAFQFFAPDETKVIILGQDPYPDRRKANGLAFGVANRETSRSFANINKELLDDKGVSLPLEDQHLELWASQGVLLLNNCLTTLHGEINAHAAIGWQDFTDDVLRVLLARDLNLPVVAWGSAAKSKAAKYRPANLITGSHPSPQSAHRGFFGTKPFTKVNQALVNQGKEPIVWGW